MQLMFILEYFFVILITFFTVGTIAYETIHNVNNSNSSIIFFTINIIITTN